MRYYKLQQPTKQLGAKPQTLKLQLLRNAINRLAKLRQIT